MKNGEYLIKGSNGYIVILLGEFNIIQTRY